MDKPVTKEQIGSIVALLVAGKVPFEDAQAFVDKYKSMPSEKKRKQGVQIEGLYLIQVESTSMPDKQSLAAAYDTIHGLEYHDYGIHGSLQKILPSTGEKSAFLKKFDSTVNSQFVVDWAKKNGFRLAFPWEREAFSRKFPDLQRRSWILDLGTCDRRYHYDSAVRLSGGPTYGRTLSISDGRWRKHCRFLLIKLD